MKKTCHRRQHPAAPYTRSLLLSTLILLVCGAFEVTPIKHPVRFWIDDYAFSEGETTLLREQIQASQGAAVISGEARGSGFLSNKGFFSPEAWDVYWANRQGCLKALPHMRPGQRVNCVPGVTALTDKRRLVETLVEAYGSGAFGIIPRTFLLPGQFWDWRLWMARQAAVHVQEERLWVLKENAHRGQGIAVLPERQAVAKAGSTDGGLEMAQAYIGDQYTVAGRKFYLRVWVVVTNVDPLRVLLFKGGVVPFGPLLPGQAGNATGEGSCPAADEASNGGTCATVEEPHAASEQDSLIVNLWRNRGDAVIWDVEQLRQHVRREHSSDAPFEALWHGVERSIGLAFAAAQPTLRVAAGEFPHPPGVAFELLGVDFLVDAALRPWLLEVNAVPSMARQALACEGGAAVEGCGAPSNAFDRQKEALMAALFRLLLLVPAAGGAQDDPGSIGGAEAARQLGFAPLCAASREAVQVSEADQPIMAWEDAESMRAADWRGIAACAVRWVWKALEAGPQQAAVCLFQSMPPKALMLLSAKLPGADAVLLSAKRLATPLQEVPGAVPAARQVARSAADVRLCDRLHAVGEGHETA